MIMKKIFFILAAGAAMVSCSKADMNADSSSGDFSNEVPVMMEFGGLEFEGSEASTKILDAVTGKTHTFTWEVGDQMTMILYKKPTVAGELASDNVMNFSATNRFSATVEGVSTTFKGTLPKDKIQEKWGSSGNIPMWAIYPATNLTVAQTSAATYYEISGPSFPEVQDGTGLKYCYFVAAKPNFSLQYFKTSSTAQDGTKPNFWLSNALVKFTMNSTKSVKKIVIDGTASGSYLTGDIKYYTNSYGVQNGVAGRVLTIDNGGILPSEVYFACRLLNTKGNITFTFTAEDNSTAVKTLKPAAQYVSMKIYDLGTVTLDNWTPAE